MDGPKGVLAIFRGELLTSFISMIPNFIAELPVFSLFGAIFRRLFGPPKKPLNLLQHGAPNKRAKSGNGVIKNNQTHKLKKQKSTSTATQTRSKALTNGSSTGVVHHQTDSILSNGTLAARAKAESEKRLEEATTRLNSLTGELNRLRESLFVAEKRLADERANCQLARDNLESERCKVKELQLELARISDEHSKTKQQLEDQLESQEQSEMATRQTVSELARELEELQEKLSANSKSHIERLRNADENERKLADLRDGLSVLLPGIDTREAFVDSKDTDWVQRYLEAIRHLSDTVQELRSQNETKTNTSKSSNSRYGSPTFSGRVSKGKFQPLIFINHPSPPPLNNTTDHFCTTKLEATKPIITTGRSRKQNFWR